MLWRVVRRGVNENDEDDDGEEDEEDGEQVDVDVCVIGLMNRLHLSLVAARCVARCMLCCDRGVRVRVFAAACVDVAMRLFVG